VPPPFKRICPKSVNIIWTDIVLNMYAKFGQTGNHRGPALDLKILILARMRPRKPFLVWTPVDFLDLGPRAAVDKALQRLAQSNDIRRIDRGLYDVPTVNRLTGKATTPDYTAIIDAVARRDQIRILVDGLTAANQLGLADAVPAHVVVHTDARIRSIKLGKLTITFKLTAPSRLYWAGRPAMRVVQALHWLRDLLPTDQTRILKRLQSIISDPAHGAAIRQDLAAGIHTLPTWMQDLVRGAIGQRHSSNGASKMPASRP
jgi:hypothetical protein